jgi:hypothetical protein
MAQTMYTDVSKCKSDKIKNKKGDKVSITKSLIEDFLFTIVLLLLCFVFISLCALLAQNLTWNNKWIINKTLLSENRCKMMIQYSEVQTTL